MSTSTGAEGRPITTTTIQEDMTGFMTRTFGARPKVLHFLPLVDGICSEAYGEDDGFCVPRQMSQVLNVDLGTLMNDMDAINGSVDWRERGATPQNVLDYAKIKRIKLVILHGTRLCQYHCPSTTSIDFLVVSFWEQHCYFWCGRAAKTLFRRYNHATPSDSLNDKCIMRPRSGGARKLSDMTT